MDYRALVQKLGDRTNQNSQTSELILEHRTGHPSNLIILTLVYIVSPYLIPMFIKVEVNNIINYFNIFLLVLVFSVSNEILGFPYLGILGQIKEVKDSTWYASLFYLSLLFLFLFFGMVNILNLILLLLGTNIVSLLFRLWFIKKSLSRA